VDAAQIVHPGSCHATLHPHLPLQQSLPQFLTMLFHLVHHMKVYAENTHQANANDEEMPMMISLMMTL